VGLAGNYLAGTLHIQNKRWALNLIRVTLSVSSQRSPSVMRHAGNEYTQEGLGGHLFAHHTSSGERQRGHAMTIVQPYWGPLQ